MAYDLPREHEVLCRYAECAGAELRRCVPEVYERQAEIVESQVGSCWRLPGGAFTSGIANKDNALAYHRDQGNFNGTWNVMYAFTHDIEGGLLVLPELRVAVEFDEPSVILFDGANRMHGVSKIRRKTRRGYRYTAVYYALSGMAHCGTPEEELARIRDVKTKREHGRRVDAAS